MRIISGRLGGRTFNSPKNHRTHPMSDKVRGGLFNVLGDISDLTVLDAFAGTGAISFEAISRGARSATAIESDAQAQRVILENIRGLGVTDSVKLIKASVSGWLATTADKFDLVIADPPYDNVSESLLTELAGRANTGGLVIISLPPTTTFSLSPADFELITMKAYGDASLVFYRRIP